MRYEIGLAIMEVMKVCSLIGLGLWITIAIKEFW